MNFPAPPTFNDPSLSQAPAASSRSLVPSPLSSHQNLQHSQQHQMQPQQQPQQQQQQQVYLMNGINGNVPAGIVQLPTPAGHQAELNYIYGMVEELSRQLAENRRVTEEIVAGLGKVRNRARSQGVSNDELIGSTAEEINGMIEVYFLDF
jgi:hypothetical protein